MATEREAAVERKGAMVIECGSPVRNRRCKEPLIFRLRQPLSFEEGDGLVEQLHVAAHSDVVSGGIGEPCLVVRNSRAYSLSRVWQPLVLHIAFDELTARRAH